MTEGIKRKKPQEVDQSQGEGRMEQFCDVQVSQFSPGRRGP